MVKVRTYEEINHRIRSGEAVVMTAEEIIDLRPSEAAQERLRYLLDGNRNESLSDAERAELDAYLQVEHFVRQLKIRAREKLSGKT